MSQSAIYTVNNTTATLSTGDTIPLGGVKRRFGCNCKMVDSTSIMLAGKGYYRIEGNFTLTPSASDTYTVKAYKNGVEIVGGFTSFTGSIKDTLPILVLDRIKCCDGQQLITFEIEIGTDTNTATLDRAEVLIEKIYD